MSSVGDLTENGLQNCPAKLPLKLGPQSRDFVEQNYALDKGAPDPLSTKSAPVRTLQEGTLLT